MSQGLVIINTGDGKGKTTAAFGMILRAIGHKYHSEVIQFIKAHRSGEVVALQKLAPDLVTIHTFGLGFTWNSEDISIDTIAAQKGWDLAKAALQNNANSIVLLDEITYPINMDMIPFDEVIDALQNRPHSMHVIITGRDANEALVKIADCVSVISPTKHHFDNNIQSQKGIEL